MNIIEEYNKLEDKLDSLDFLEDANEYLETLEEIYLFFQKVVIKENTKTLDEYINNYLHGSTYLLELLIKNDIFKYYLLSKDERILKYLLKFSNMILNTFSVTYLTREFVYVYATSLYFLDMKQEAINIVKYYIEKDNAFATGHIFIAETKILEGKEKEAVKYLSAENKKILDLEENVKILEKIIEIKKVIHLEYAKEEKELQKVYSDIKKERRSTFWYPYFKDDKMFLEVVSDCVDMEKILTYLKVEKIESLKEVKYNLDNEIDNCTKVSDYLDYYKNIDEKLDVYMHIKLSYVIEDAISNLERETISLEKKGYTMSSINIILDTIKYVMQDDVNISLEKLDFVNEYLFRLKEILKKNKMTYEKHREIIDILKDMLKSAKMPLKIKYAIIREIIAITNKKDEIGAFYLKQTMEKLKQDKNNLIQEFYEIEFDYLFKFETANKLLDTVENNNVIKSIRLLNKVLDMYLLMEKNKEIEIIIHYATKYSMTIQLEEEKLAYIKNLFIYKKFLAKNTGDFEKYQKYLKNEIELFPYVSKIKEYEEYFDIEELIKNINVKEIRKRTEDVYYTQLVLYLVQNEMYKELYKIIKQDIYMLIKYESYCVLYNKEKVIQAYKKYLEKIEIKTRYDLELKNILNTRIDYLN